MTFVSVAVLSRYLDKPEYGAYKQVMYVYTTLQTVFVIGLPSIFAYFIPRLSHGQGKTLVYKFTIILGLLGAILSFVLFFGATLIAQILNNAELASGLKIFAFVPLLTLPTIGVEGIYTALRKTNQFAIYQIISKIFNLIFIVGPIVLFGGSYKTALIGWTIAALIIFIYALWMVNRPYIKINAELIPDLYRMVFKYSIPLMGVSIVGMLLFTANQFFISRYYGSVVFAEFSNGYIPLPLLGLIISPVRNVIFPLFSKASYERDYQAMYQTYKTIISKVISIAIPLIVFCMFFAKDIIVLLYGSRYEVSKIYFQISLIKDFFDVLPYFAVLLAFGKSIVYFYAYLLAATVTCVVDAFIVYNQLDPVFIAVVSSAAHVIIVVSVQLYLHYVLNFRIIQPIKKHLLIISSHTVSIACIVLLIKIFYFNELGSITNLMICGSVFLLLLVTTGKRLKINYMESISMMYRHFHSMLSG